MRDVCGREEGRKGGERGDQPTKGSSRMSGVATRSLPI